MLFFYHETNNFQIEKMTTIVNQLNPTIPLSQMSRGQACLDYAMARNSLTLVNDYFEHQRFHTPKQKR